MRRGRARRRRASRLLSALAPYLSSATQAQQLLELFLPYLRLKPTPRAERVKEQVLRLVGGLLPLLERPELHLRFFGQMFAQLRARGGRAALCELWTRLAALPATAAAADLGEIGAVAAASTNSTPSMARASTSLITSAASLALRRAAAARQPRAAAAAAPAARQRDSRRRARRRRAAPLGHPHDHAARPPRRRRAAARRRHAADGRAGLLERVLMPALRRHLRLPPSATRSSSKR